MSSLKDIMSIIDRTGAKTQATVSKQGPPAGAPRPAPRPIGGASSASQTPQLKRKASGPVESTQVKIQRKEAVGGSAQANGAVRATSSPATSKPAPSASTTAVPYRGTAAPASSKPANPPVRKPLQSSNAPAAKPKAAAPAPKPAPAATTSTPASSAAPKKGYLAMLQKAKEKDSTKPIAPPIKHEPTKILTRKERLALKAEASAGAKGKKPVAGLPSRTTDPKADPSKDKKKAVEVGYQGTARPAKKPVEVGYKGTARPTSAPATSSRNGTPAVKAKPNPGKGRYDGYADWDELSEMEDEEEDYASDASSDMEGGIWDVEEEEQIALKVAKKEDAEALAEENRLKREKEERKKKLMAMAAKAKKRF
ncbi:uncharacterized protein J4E84_009013 [Alternaria hordeiaustralica]|uniref:uncharacterized protein n=1 Tax=Alternaria hordeiaustralica TaxID=1187925 RepID=UPI0020C2E630|nr:uncharacterized protein J4E84_009013 [Alternaria hordeiaustralica]KAI4677694.1 hypothetical protein J4E84_009013 [Alternaria hordeiaustralica]